MPGSLLETKLFAPRRRPGLVARPRLEARLRHGHDARLTLVSAPAGFGKTTLVTQLLAARGDRPAAWVSLDAGDDDPASFWAYVIAAVGAAVPGVGGEARVLLDTPGTPIERVLTSLLNDLGNGAGGVTLVLDDYHVIGAPDIHAGMTFLLDHLAPGMQVVITTRADPPLPLPRLRARGELVEIRASDLRFTPDEAAAYLGGTMGLALTTHDVETLERRTEGWIAAIQLAGLSMQGRDDLTGFIDGFAGDDRYIVDYLVEEVLERQPAELHDFLLRTSILARLSGPLCDAVTGQTDGRFTLEALERANLFLVPLDDRRRWYRYHQLFAEVLQARLQDEQPDLVPALHRRASAWFEQHGEQADAVRHAMAGGDVERAAMLVELAIPELRRTRQEVRLRSWLEALPMEVFPDRPVLALGYVGALMSTGEVAGVELLLSQVERWLVPTPPPGMIVADRDELARLPGAVAMYRAGLARMRGDVAATMAHARHALEVIPPTDHLVRGAAGALLGLASWTVGDLGNAQRCYLQGMADLELAGHLSDVVGCTIALADMQLAEGRLRDAEHTYAHGLALAVGTGGGPPLRGAADMHVGLAELARERDDLAAAAAHLATCHALGEENGLPQSAYRWRVAAARLRLAEGDPDGAVALLDEAERRYRGDYSPDVRPTAALRARVWIGQGRLAEAWGWARARGLAAADPLDYLHEFEHATLARLLLAQGVRDRSDAVIREAIVLAGRSLHAAEEGARSGSALDILLVQALALQAAGDAAGAVVALGRAVDLADREGYTRSFLDEGPPMVALLRLAARSADAPAGVRRLLSAAVAPGAAGDRNGPTGHGAAARQPLVEPLSDREVDVLRLLASDLDGPAIASALFISLNTMRTHTKNIYAKLGVNDRRAAVRRATDLGLLANPTGDRPIA